MSCRCDDTSTLGDLVGDAMRAGRARLTTLGQDAFRVAHRWRAIRDRWLAVSERESMSLVERTAARLQAGAAEGRRRDAVKVYDWLADARDLLGGQAGRVEGLGALPLPALVVGGVAVASLSGVAALLVQWGREATQAEAQQARAQTAWQCVQRTQGEAQQECAEALNRALRQPEQAGSSMLTWIALAVGGLVAARLAGAI